jgi:glycerol-3-phosphate O-acyltransferase / dihydroxyacetone phosphate acyltransferase
MMTPPAAATEPTDFLYRAVRAVGRFWLWFFFKAVEARDAERVPAAGPVLLCINHPNNLIDSLLVAAVLDRKVHYMATASLFRNPLQGRFLRACGAIPIYRREDDPDKMDRNIDTFAACLETLARGGVIGMYPEGTTHAERRVQRIKTGAARIALEYEADRARGQAPGRSPLAVIPVGLTFEARKSFGGRVRVAFGDPVPVTPHLDLYHDDPAKAVNGLTDAVQWAMEALVVQVDRLEVAGVARAVEALYRDRLVRELHDERGLSPEQIDTVRLARSIASAVAYFERHDPARVAHIRTRISAYRALLAAYRIRDEAVRERLAHRPARQRLGRGGIAFAGLPVFVYGAAVNALPYLLPRWIARRTARKETDYATTRFLASVVAYPLFWGLQTWLVWRLRGPGWALAFLVSLPVTGLLAYHYFAGIGRLRLQLQLAVLSLTRAQAASRLLVQRQALIAELDRARDEYLAAISGAQP